MLSASTEDCDLDEKFVDYQQLASLEEYVLISQTTQRVECRRRTQSHRWATVAYQPGDRVLLTSIGLEFDLSELYRGLDPQT